jgi:hypothetical protein
LYAKVITMTTSSSAPVVAAVLALVSDDSAEKLTSALKSMHGVVASYDGTTLPTFSDCSDEEYQAICIRSINALIRLRKARRLAALDGVKAKVQGVLDTHLAAQRLLKAQYDAVPAAIRPMLPPFPMQCSVPLADIVGCFPQGEAEGAIVKSLHDMSFTVSKPDLRTKTKHAYTVIFPFTDAPAVAEGAPATLDAPLSAAAE